MEVDQLEIDGVAVRIYRGQDASSGPTPPVVMVHDGLHASWCWDRWAEHLAAAGRDCWLFDWFGHGESSSQQVDSFCSRGIQRVAEQEMEAIRGWFRRRRRLFRPVVVGHGLGALAALTYAVRVTSDVSKLVLVSPAVPMQVQAEVMPVEVEFGTPFAPPPFEVAKRLFFTTMSERQARREYRRLGPESPRAMWEATRSTTWVPLVNVTCPTLVVTGQKDALFPPANGSMLAKLLGAQPPVELAGLGHSDVLLKDDGWQAGADAVRDWIQPR
jgi:pimeloyl-ACP methyl ester carboxylesterase